MDSEQDSKKRVKHPDRVTLTPEALTDRTARLKRAAKKTPLVISAVSHQGVAQALRALRSVIDQAAEQPKEAAAWRP